MPRATMRREDGLLIGPYSANAGEPLGPQTARVCGEAPATPPEQPQGLAGVCEVGVGGLFGRMDQSMRLILIQPSAPRVQAAACNRDSNQA
jgi:hypothetical protein